MLLAGANQGCRELIAAHRIRSPAWLGSARRAICSVPMLGAYGYRVERFSDWAGLLRDNPSTEEFGDYAGQKRITIRCTTTTAAPA